MAGTENIATEKALGSPSPEPVRPIIYFNVLHFLYWHVAGLYGLYLAITSAKWATILLACVMFLAGDIGVTAGAHRLWSHRSYRARRPLQVLLMLFHSIAFQNTVLSWARDHRQHHRFCDTDADPHNASRGFFYSHIGWLLMRRHPRYHEQGKSIDVSDLYENPVLQFQKKYKVLLVGGLSLALPTLLPLCWGESLNTAWHVNVLRYAFSLNVTFLVNSIAHMWGSRPFDANISPRRCWLAVVFTLGEGFHNYHHVFPWDYRTAELGYEHLNLVTKVIDFFAWVGWAYDLKTVPRDVVYRRANKTGDGTLRNIEEPDKYAEVLSPAHENL